jgi:hypothetical protein
MKYHFSLVKSLLSPWVFADFPMPGLAFRGRHRALLGAVFGFGNATAAPTLRASAVSAPGEAPRRYQTLVDLPVGKERYPGWLDIREIPSYFLENPWLYICIYIYVYIPYFISNQPGFRGCIPYFMVISGGLTMKNGDITKYNWKSLGLNEEKWFDPSKTRGFCELSWFITRVTSWFIFLANDHC